MIIPSDLRDDLLRPDYGDSFQTGEEVVAMLEHDMKVEALIRMERCVSLHQRCGNFIKAGYIAGLMDSVKARVV